MVVSDLDDIFIPLPDDLLVNLSESREVVETFLDSLPSMFENNINVESAFGPALKAAFMVMVCYNFFLLSYLIIILSFLHTVRACIVKFSFLPVKSFIHCS